MGLSLLIGGARSGKSALAVETARRSGRPVIFVATAAPRDAEFAERVARHRAARPAEWEVEEAPLALGATLQDAPPEACLIVDCLSLWVANLLERGTPPDETELIGASTAAIAAGRAAPTIAVTNEVGLGIVPAGALARTYRDLLGRVNTAWARAAEEATLVVAGRVLPLWPPNPRSTR